MTAVDGMKKPGSSFFASVGALTASRVVLVVSQIAILPVIARFLTAADFGAFALAMSVVIFSQILSDAGLGRSLIRQPEVDELEWSSVFWLLAGVGAALSAVQLLHELPDRSEFLEYFIRLSESDWLVPHVMYTWEPVGVEFVTLLMEGVELAPASVISRLISSKSAIVSVLPPEGLSKSQINLIFHVPVASILEVTSLFSEYQTVVPGLTLVVLVQLHATVSSGRIS